MPDTSTTIKFDPGLPDREKILSIIADEPNILDVLDVGGDWWIAWEDQYPGARDLKARLTVRDSVSKQLADMDAVTVATGLICIVTSLQQVRVGIDDHNLQLSTSTNRLVERITVAVDQVILSKETYTESMMGVQLLILKAKQHADGNQLRKAWLRIRQAIHTAQKIDLARPLPGMTPAEILGRQRFMGSMFETDRFMSLLLGLPYAMDENFNDKLATEIIGEHPDIIMRVRALRRITAIASGHINDRNASSEPASISATGLIQDTLTRAELSLPVEWWDIASHTTNLTDPMLAHENLMTQLWFYQTQAFLQLPFMLKAASDPSLEWSRVTCLDSCRSLITIFNTLRSNPPLSAYTCKCEDFQGLLGAIVLLIGLLQYASTDQEPTERTFEADIQLIDITKETFRYSRQQQGGNIAKQGLHVLDTLSTFLESHGQDNKEPRKATLFVPYFGTISVEAAPVWRPKKFIVQKDVLSNDIVWTHDSVPAHGAANILEPDSGFPEIDQQHYSWSTDDPSPSKIDWDIILMGPELQQDWNFVPVPMTALI